MSRNSLNIVDAIKAYLPDDFATRISSLLGENRDKTQAGISAGIPGLLAGLDNASSSPDGAGRLASAVSNADDSLLGNVPGMLSKFSTTDSGLGSIRSIMGAGGLSELTGNLGRSSGLSGKALASLLGLLAPMVLGALKRIMLTERLQPSDIPNLLSRQRANIAAAMPGGMMGTERLRDVTEETYTAPRAARSETRTERPRSGGVPSWLLPLALLALALGLLWHFASRPTVHAGREAAKPTERATRGYGDQSGYGTATSLAALKARYQSVFKEAATQGVQISDVSQQNGKLVLKGTAPSLDAANAVWNEIKRVDPMMEHIAASFPVVGPSMPPSGSRDPAPTH